MRRTIVILLLLLLFCSKRVAGNCQCNGIIINGPDQEHCWQIEPRSEQTWSSADNACLSVGGHLAHPVESSMKQVWDYVSKTSNKPVLTGIVAGNVEIPIYATMCQENKFYDVYPSNSSTIETGASDKETCAFITKDSAHLTFQQCSTESMVLCDIPLEKHDYCNIMAECTSTTMTTTTTTMVEEDTTVSTGMTNPVSTILDTLTNTSTITTINIIRDKTTIKMTTNKNPNATEAPVVTTTLQEKTNTNTPKVIDPLIPKETTTVPCASQRGCLKHQWKIFGMCVDWRAMLAMALIGLLLFTCCYICHCCLSACMWCKPRKREREILDPVQIPPKTDNNIIAPVTAPKIDYKPDNVILPPPTIAPEPVIITVPERHESVYGFHTKEVIHVQGEKPRMVDVGVNTEPMESFPVPAPVVKKKIKKPTKMFIPAAVTPIDEIDDELKEDIPLDLHIESPVHSIAPLGDIEQPFDFTRNAKPLTPQPKQRALPKYSPLPSAQPTEATQPVTEDPRAIRSPPPPIGDNQSLKPEKMSFSPISDESDEELNNIPSPPPPSSEPTKAPKAPVNPAPTSYTPPPTNAAPVKKALSPSNSPPIPLKREKGNVDVPPQRDVRSNNSTPNKAKQAPSGAPTPSHHNPFANLNPNQESPMPSSQNMPNVGMRAARGKLGGVVKGGGGGGVAPSGWKPWAKGNRQ